MKTLITVLILTSAVGQATGTVPAIVIDLDGPAESAETLQLRELWRTGGDDDEIFFGRITDVKRHPSGDVYVLDNQLCQVVVFDAEGMYLRTLSRQGDGPGELRQPMGLVFLPGDILGVGMGFPGKMVTMELDGTPIASHYPIGEPADGNVGVMISLDYADGVLVASGGTLVFEGNGNSHTLRFLSVSEPGSPDYTRILERETPMDPTGRRFVEKNDYYIDRSWDICPEGRIYAPMKRDAYEVSVFDRTGQLQFAFGRDLKSRRRTTDDKDEVSPLIDVSGNTDRSDWDIADRDEAVTRVMAHPYDGTIWVLTPNGANDQPEGILETWDVFSPTGEFLRQVAVPLGDEIRDGSCHLVGGGRMIVIRGTGSSFHGESDEDLDEDLDAEPLELICYEIR